MPRVIEGTLDTREVMTGKDGRLFVSAGGRNVLMAEVDKYAVKMTVNSVEKQPVGDIIKHKVPTGVSYELTFTEMVVRDDLIMEPLLDAIQKGNLPDFNFQGVTVKPDGTEQRMTFDNAVPDGTFDLQTITPGEVIEREMSFTLNKHPKFTNSLKSTYLAAVDNSTGDSTLDKV